MQRRIVCGVIGGEGVGLVQPPTDPQPHSVAGDRLSDGAAAGRTNLRHVSTSAQGRHAPKTGQLSQRLFAYFAWWPCRICQRFQASF